MLSPVPAPELIAHRGYALRYPENTLASVRAAIEAGARFVEIDVQLDRERRPWLLHDRTLERTCGVPGALAELSSARAAELRASEPARFGARFAGEPLASLEGFVELVARSAGVRAFVELKRASLEVLGPDAVLDAVLPALEPLRGRATLISFDGAVLLRARERASFPVGPVLIHWAQTESPELASLRPEVVFCDLEKLPPDGPLRAPAPLAVYEVADADLALALHARGARFVETFAIAEMLRGLAERRG
jgi:glycerophosphoryl diester phosphodiesterase